MSQNSIKAWAAASAGDELKPFEYDPGPLAPEQVEIEVTHCGLCHSDLSMLDNEWGVSQYPLVPGHEAVGRVVALGDAAQDKGLSIGQAVGVGWLSGSCMHCNSCLSGDHNLCADNEVTIAGRYGGFADRLRAHWAWAIPLPESLDMASAGPLFCGGVTVFNPIVELDIKPTDRVGVVGIGGLGHLALQFLNAWGCDVTAFTSSEAKREEAMSLGAHHVVTSTDKASLKAVRESLDFILVTANASLDWRQFINALGPKGKLHFVGAVLEPIPVSVFDLLGKQRSVSASPVGSPARLRQMLDFCARHGIEAQVEPFPMSQVNRAVAHLKSGKARYRVVLENT
ncbi:mannitol dehydrogenase [gamma proteobacterium HTCC5015]|nr:mannitol dehydrogenase [gamma proteobacterium HTCC5015]